MTLSRSSEEIIIDYITGRPRPNVGAEANRQIVERLLVEKKGFMKHQIHVDVPIHMEIDDEMYISLVDIVVHVKDHPYMVIKCAPGSLASREREVVAAARLLAAHQIPLSISSDGQTAYIWDTLSGKSIGSGLDAIPTKTLAEQIFDPAKMTSLPASKRRRQQLIFRSYDTMNVNKAF